MRKRLALGRRRVINIECDLYGVFINDEVTQRSKTAKQIRYIKNLFNTFETVKQWKKKKGMNILTRDKGSRDHRDKEKGEKIQKISTTLLRPSTQPSTRPSSQSLTQQYKYRKQKSFQLFNMTTLSFRNYLTASIASSCSASEYSIRDCRHSQLHCPCSKRQSRDHFPPSWNQ